MGGSWLEPPWWTVGAWALGTIGRGSGDMNVWRPDAVSSCSGGYSHSMVPGGFEVTS